MTSPPFMLADPIVIELAGEPKGVARPRFVRKTGIAFTPAATRSYQDALRLAAQQAMNGEPPLAGAVKVTVHALFPVPASWSKKRQREAIAGIIRPTVKPDIDNIAKNFDGLNQVVWADDKQIVDARVVKSYSERPALRVEVEVA